MRASRFGHGSFFRCSRFASLGLTLGLVVGWLAAPVGFAQSSKPLPWTKQAAPGKPSARRAQSARDLLVNVEASQWANFRDGQDLSVDEDETLYRVLYRMPTIDGNESHRLAREWNSAATDMSPSAARGELFRVTGRAVAADRVEILPEVARRLGFEYYWRVRIELAGSRQAIVCARSIPARWRSAPAIDERCATYGLFLKTGAKGDAEAPYYLAADRIEWLPDRPDSDRGITPAHVLLAELGFDFSRLADLDGRDARPLGAADQECFYQMLRAAGRATPAQLQAAAPFEIAPFLVKPAEHHGDLYRLQARVKRITPVAIDDPELEERFGFDRYYQLDMVIGLGNQEVRLAKGPDDKEAPVVKNAFPLVCCVKELPKSLLAVVERREINEDVEFEAFYFRLWSFQSAMLNRFAVEQGTGEDGEVDQKKVDAARRRQPSPLFIAGTVRIAEHDDSERVWFGKVMGGVIVAIIAGLLLMKWYGGVADRRAREQLRRTMRAEGP